jgi:hypothetical protein
MSWTLHLNLCFCRQVIKLNEQLIKLNELLIKLNELLIKLNELLARLHKSFIMPNAWRLNLIEPFVFVPVLFNKL